MKPNADKGHSLLNPPESNVSKIGSFKIKNHSEKLLGVNFDSTLIALPKQNALVRLTLFMGLFKCMLLIYAFFKSQLNYCALIWMCCNRS